MMMSLFGALLGPFPGPSVVLTLNLGVTVERGRGCNVMAVYF